MSEAQLGAALLVQIHTSLAKIEEGIDDGAMCAYCVIDVLLDLVAVAAGIAAIAGDSGSQVRGVTSDLLAAATAEGIRAALQARM